MIVVELVWAAAIAGGAYFVVQQIIALERREKAARARAKAAEEEARPLREEPPWGSPT